MQILRPNSLPVSKLFYHPVRKSMLVCDWDPISGSWRINGDDHKRTSVRHLSSLIAQLRKEGYEEAPIGSN